MSEELIDQYVDRGKFSSDTEFIKAELKEVLEAYEKVKSVKINIQGASSTKGVAAAAEEGIKANARLNESTKAVISLVNQRFATEAKLITLQTDYAKATAANRVEIQKQNAELKNQAQLQAANSGSLEKARASVKALRTEQETLNLYTEEGQKRNAELITQIDKYNAFIKKNSDALAQQKINVGNYSGAINILKGSLDEVSKKIDANTKAGKGNTAANQALQKEQGILKQLVDSQAAGFAKASLEIRANEKALLDLAKAGLENTESYKQLALATGKLKDDLGDIKARTKALGSDTFAFDGLISGAQTLAGVYGVAQGAQELFGQGNEELQKTFVKLQATMTVIQGLQSVANGLQKENAAILLLQQVREKALLGFQVLRNFVLRGSISATAGNVVATNADTTAKAANTVATRAATTAAVGFRAALIATGIGAILILITSAASAMGKFGDETKESTFDLDKFNESLEYGNELLNIRLDSIKFAGKIDIERAKQRGASEQELSGLELKNLELQRATLLENARVSQGLLDDELKKTKDFNKAKAEGYAKQIEANKNLANSITSDIELKKEQDLTKIAEKGFADRKKLADEAKKRAEEYAKAELAAQIEITRLAIEDRKNVARSIVDDEKKDFADRLTALANFNKASQELIDFEKNTVLKDNKKSPKEKQLAEDKAVIATRDLKLASEKAVQDLFEKNAEKRRGIQEKEMEEYRRREEQKRQIARDLVETDLNKAELALRAQFELDAAGKSADRRRELEQKLQEDITAYREKAALVQLQLDEAELLRKRTILLLFKQDTAAIDKLITENELAQSEKRIGIARTEAEKKRDAKIKGFEEAAAYEAQAADLLSGLLQAKDTREKNRLQDQIDTIETKKNREIEAITASSLSEQEKADKIAVINANAQAKKEQLEKRQRQIDLQRAKFEKELGILQLTIALAIAIAKGKVFEAVAAGAALIKAIATPLPRFKDGKDENNKYEGFGITNDGGKIEPIRRAATGKIEIPTNRNNLTFLAKDDIVWPSMEAMMKSMSMPKLPGVPSEKSIDLAAALNNNAKQIVSAISKKESVNLKVTRSGAEASIDYINRQISYVNENTQFG